jgi:ribonuclease D
MQELCRFREEQAKKLNLPPFKVLSNELLLALCLEPPASEDELKGVRGMTDRIFRQYGAGLQAALKRGLENPPLRRESRIRPDETFLNRLDALKDWRKQRGKELKVESDVVLPREIMEQIAERNPASLGELKTIMQMVPWRFAHFGNDIHSVLRKLEGS